MCLRERLWPGCLRPLSEIGFYKMSERSCPKVLVVYQHLPHYRRGVFLELDRLSSYRFVFAADPSGRDGIQTMKMSDLRETRGLRNLWLGNALFQRGLLVTLLRERPDAAI